MVEKETTSVGVVVKKSLFWYHDHWTDESGCKQIHNSFVNVCMTLKGSHYKMFLYSAIVVFSAASRPLRRDPR